MCEAAVFDVFLAPTLKIIQSFQYPVPPHSNYTFLLQHKKREGKEKVIK